MVQRFQWLRENLRRQFVGPGIEKLQCHPVLIAMMGHPYTGRKVAAYLLAATLKCPLVKEEDIGAKSNYQLICRIAESHLNFGLSVIVDSQLSDQSHFNQLQNLAQSTKSQLLIVECRPYDEIELWWSLQGEEENENEYKDEEEYEVQALITQWWDKPSSLEDLQRQLLETANTYDAGETPKFIMKMSVDGDYYNCVSKVLLSIVSQLYPDQHPVEGGCENCHDIDFNDEQENDETTCDDCSKPVSRFTSYKCTRQGCNFIFHKSCTNQLPSELFVREHCSSSIIHLRNADDCSSSIIHLRNAEDYKNSGGVWCSCCKELITGYFYQINDESVLDLKCLFLPSKRRVKFHKHRLQLAFDFRGFTCCQCGIDYDYTLTLHYVCHRCGFRVDMSCAWLPDIAKYERHRYPFKLTLRPQDDKELCYCMCCQEIIYPNFWMYNCEGGCHAAHTRCLVPSYVPSARPTGND